MYKMTIYFGDNRELFFNTLDKYLRDFDSLNKYKLAITFKFTLKNQMKSLKEIVKLNKISYEIVRNKIEKIEENFF